MINKYTNLLYFAYYLNPELSELFYLIIKTCLLDKAK